jgi:hypothetical protein
VNFVMAMILLWPQRGLALVWPEGPAEEGASYAIFVLVEIAVFPMMVRRSSRSSLLPWL